MKFLVFTLLTALVAAVPVDLDSRSLNKVLFPNYLVPIKQADPFTAYPTQYTGDVSYTPGVANEVRLLVGFDVPANAGTRCAIKFRLPPKTPFGFQWTVTGSGKLSVWSLVGIIQPGTTSWNNRPPRLTMQPQFWIEQPLEGGDAVVIGSMVDCKGGQRMDFEVAATKPLGTVFHWFELTDPKSGITLNMYN